MKFLPVETLLVHIIKSLNVIVFQAASEVNISLNMGNNNNIHKKKKTNLPRYLSLFTIAALTAEEVCTITNTL